VTRQGMRFEDKLRQLLGSLLSLGRARHHFLSLWV
jgi:hypothetical protein